MYRSTTCSTQKPGKSLKVRDRSAAAVVISHRQASPNRRGISLPAGVRQYTPKASATEVTGLPNWATLPTTCPLADCCPLACHPFPLLALPAPISSGSAYAPKASATEVTGLPNWAALPPLRCCALVPQLSQLTIQSPRAHRYVTGSLMHRSSLALV